MSTENSENSRERPGYHNIIITGLGFDKKTFGNTMARIGNDRDLKHMIRKGKGIARFWLPILLILAGFLDFIDTFHQILAGKWVEIMPATLQGWFDTALQVFGEQRPSTIRNNQSIMQYVQEPISYAVMIASFFFIALAVRSLIEEIRQQGQYFKGPVGIVPFLKMKIHFFLPNKPLDIWSPLASNISDAQVMSPLQHVMAADGSHDKSSLFFCGEPYYDSQLLDSLFVRVKKPGSHRLSILRKYNRTLRETSIRNVIMKLQQYDTLKKRLAVSSFAFGILFFSTVLNELFCCDERNPDPEEKIAIDLSPIVENYDRLQKKAEKRKKELTVDLRSQLYYALQIVQLASDAEYFEFLPLNKNAIEICLRKKIDMPDELLVSEERKIDDYPCCLTIHHLSFINQNEDKRLASEKLFEWIFSLRIFRHYGNMLIYNILCIPIKRYLCVPKVLEAYEVESAEKKREISIKSRFARRYEYIARYSSDMYTKMNFRAFFIGGTEHNLPLLYALNKQRWEQQRGYSEKFHEQEKVKMRRTGTEEKPTDQEENRIDSDPVQEPTFNYSFVENVINYDQKRQCYRLGTEGLVYGVRETKNGLEIVGRDVGPQRSNEAEVCYFRAGKPSIAKESYEGASIDSLKDFYFIYGYSAAATKIVSMYLFRMIRFEVDHPMDIHLGIPFSDLNNPVDPDAFQHPLLPNEFAYGYTYEIDIGKHEKLVKSDTLTDWDWLDLINRSDTPEIVHSFFDTHAVSIKNAFVNSAKWRDIMKGFDKNYDRLEQLYCGGPVDRRNYYEKMFELYHIPWETSFDQKTDKDLASRCNARIREQEEISKQIRRGIEDVLSRQKASGRKPKNYSHDSIFQKVIKTEK